MYRGYTEGQLLWSGPEKSRAEDMEIGDGEVVGCGRAMDPNPTDSASQCSRGKYRRGFHSHPKRVCELHVLTLVPIIRGASCWTS